MTVQFQLKQSDPGCVELYIDDNERITFSLSLSVPELQEFSIKLTDFILRITPSRELDPPRFRLGESDI